MLPLTASIRYIKQSDCPATKHWIPGGVFKGSTFREALECVFSGHICILMLIRFNWLQKRKEFVEWIIEQQIVAANFSNKSSSAMRWIFIVMTSLFNKIVAFAVQKIYKWLLWSKCIHNVSLFNANFGLNASSDYSSSIMQLVRIQGLMVFSRATIARYVCGMWFFFFFLVIRDGQSDHAILHRMMFLGFLEI